MSKHSVLGILWAVLLLAGAPPAAAAQAQPLPNPLTLEEAIARATAASHRLAELRAREGAAGAVAAQRDAAQRPTVALQAGYQRTNHVDEYIVFAPGAPRSVLYPDVPDNYRSRIELQWPIYTGGRLQALERAAAAEAAASAQDLAAARADLKLEVTRAFWAVVTARETVRVLEEALKRVDAQLGDVRTRFDAGFVPPNDVLAVEAQRARQQVLLIESQNLAASAEAELTRLIDAGDSTRLELASRLDPPAPASADLSALNAEARTQRAERAALEIRLEGAGEREAAARAGRLPMVALVSGYDYARPNSRIFPRADEWNHSWDAGVSVSWTAWDAGRTRAEMQEAAHLARAARERLAEFDSVLALDVRRRTLDLASARAQIQAADEGVRSATEARRVVQERFAAGVATSTELLDAQVALLQAELDRTRSLANARLALARLDRVLGR
jgi:outer membrane protein